MVDSQENPMRYPNIYDNLDYVKMVSQINEKL